MKARTAVCEPEVVTLYSSHKFGDKCFITYDASSLHFARGLTTFRIMVSYSCHFMVQQSALRMRCLASHDIHRQEMPVDRSTVCVHHFHPSCVTGAQIENAKMCTCSTEHAFSDPCSTYLVTCAAISDGLLAFIDREASSVVVVRIARASLKSPTEQVSPLRKHHLSVCLSVHSSQIRIGENDSEIP